MEEIRNLLLELPFTGGSHDSDDDNKPPTPPAPPIDEDGQNEQSTAKKISKPLTLPIAVELRG